MYSGTTDVLNILGGTRIISVGTGVEKITTTGMIEYFIAKADALIDVRVSPIYGTFAFGTTAYGTKGVPAIINSISSDLASWYLVDSITMPNKNSYYEYGSRLYDRASALLNQVANGELILTGYAGQDAGIPVASDFVFDFNEVINLTGTNTLKLRWDKIVGKSEVVSGTTIDSTTVYTRDTDYKVYYYDDPSSMDLVANIRRVGTTIPSDKDIKIRYKVYKDNVFGIRDARAWGKIDAGFTTGDRDTI